VLHRTTKLRGFHIEAEDGEIGHVDDFLLDDQTWAVRYLVVDTSNWIGGRSVLISPTTVDSIHSPGKRIRVRLTRAVIEKSPSMESADIELIETLPAVWIL
jgi:hypothetical protein